MQVVEVAACEHLLAAAETAGAPVVGVLEKVKAPGNILAPADDKSQFGPAARQFTASPAGCEACPGPKGGRGRPWLFCGPAVGDIVGGESGFDG